MCSLMHGVKNTRVLILLAAKTLFIERRMPYRVNQFIQDFLYKRSTDKCINAVVNTRPIILAKQKKAEVRILTNNANVNMTILALKSFLRFYNKVKVVVHDDGSIKEHAKKRIEEHIIGSKVVSLKQVDEFLQMEPNIWRYRQEAFSHFKFMPITVHKLFDLYLLSTEKKLIIMDSDILFLKEPTEVISWIEDDKLYNLYARPNLRNLIIEDHVLREKFGDLDIIKKFNSGLLCMHKDLIPFEYVLEAFNKLKNDDRTPILGDECVWRFAFSRAKSKELPFENYPLFSEIKNFKKFLKNHDDIGYVHFLLKHKGGFYKKFAKQVVNDLLH